MVRVEVGGRPIIDIPGVTVGSSRGTIRRTVNNGSRRVQFSWSKVQPRIVVTSDTDDFDEEILGHFQEEGFQIWYLAYSGDRAAYYNQLQHLSDPLEMGDLYAIVAYGDAAAHVLEACMKPMPKLCAVVAYYPPYMPKTSANFPPGLNVLIHLAGSQKFGTRHEKNFRYPRTEPGFAESDLDEYSKPNARVAWSRTLATLRTAFGTEENLESIWDDHNNVKFADKDVADVMKNMVDEPYVNHIPTMTGGIGKKDLTRFYEDFFTDENPPDFRSDLLSRTVGTDRIVDELLVSFTHTKEMNWILPGTPPTGKKVEVAIVTIAGIRGGKICHEHIHWDQATVLVQIGLLDPKYIPSSFKTTEQGKEKEVKRLPVLGREAARKVVDEESGETNKLIKDW